MDTTTTVDLFKAPNPRTYSAGDMVEVCTLGTGYAWETGTVTDWWTHQDGVHDYTVQTRPGTLPVVVWGSLIRPYR